MKCVAKHPEPFEAHEIVAIDSKTDISSVVFTFDNGGHHFGSVFGWEHVKVGDYFLNPNNIVDRDLFRSKHVREDGLPWSV